MMRGEEMLNIQCEQLLLMLTGSLSETILQVLQHFLYGEELEEVSDVC